MSLILFAVFLSVAVTLSEAKLALPHFSENQWKAHNQNVKGIIDPIHFGLSNGIISTLEASKEFTSQLRDYLSGEADFNNSQGNGRRRQRRDTDISDEALVRAKEEKMGPRKFCFPFFRLLRMRLHYITCY